MTSAQLCRSLDMCFCQPTRSSSYGNVLSVLVIGWQQRWFVLDAGNLAYYLAPDEVSQGCRGSLKVTSCDIHGKRYIRPINIDSV